VPKQKGLDAPVWIAPECDACRLGEVPSMLIDREALVLRAKQRPGNVSADVEARMEPVASRPLGLATSLRTYSATVSDTLDLALRWTTANEDHAWLGPRKDARVEPLSKLKKDAETSLRERLPGSALLEYVPFTLDPSLRRGTRTFVAEAPAHAVADRETRTVPLTMLTDVIGDDFEARTRRTSILVKSPSVTRDELRLRVPAGWKLTRPCTFPVGLASCGRQAACIQFSYDCVQGRKARRADFRNRRRDGLRVLDGLCLQSGRSKGQIGLDPRKPPRTLPRALVAASAPYVGRR
jgi:hypothetical protein